jgi:hypothetical protein
MIRFSFGMACLLIGVTCGGVALLANEPLLHPGPARLIPLLGEDQQNLVPNASFECGADGWGSTELDRLLDWYGPLNGLFGRLDSSAATDGRQSLKIELTPENQPVEYDDYLHTQSRRIRAPLAANVGWLAVKPGRPYTFSVAMKAAEAGTPARLVVRQFRRAPVEKFVRLSTDWQRYVLEFTPQAEACYVLAGPDLRPTKECAHPPRRATVWLDAVQLAPGTATRSFATRQPVELGVVTCKPGNIFAWHEPLGFHLTVASADRQRDREATIDLRLTDFFDREVWRETLSLTVPAGSSEERTVVAPASPQRRGFLRLHATLRSGSTVEQRRLRLASIPIYDQEDSCFGLNHAFGWPELLDLCRQAGLVWARDWSLKWQDVEPKKGHFTFAETDAEINRILRQGIKVMSVPGFPSNMWSTTAPASVKRHDPWYETSTKAPDPETQRDEVLYEVGWPFMRMAYPPRDMAEFKNYVAEIVGHYKGRIRDWEVFNESLYTLYSLPQRAGFKMADYLRYQEAFIEAARKANPECRILGGCCYVSERMENPGEFIKLGGLKNIDIFTLHYYPGRTPPEQLEPWFQRLGGMMDRYGIRRPIWITETAYSADDDPWITPANVYLTTPAYLASERMQAEYEVRYNTILLANGVEKIFYHAGTGSAINHDNLFTMFLRYGSQPYKSYASQAVQAKLLTPACKFVKRLLPGEPLRAYLFHDGRRAVAVVWAPAGAKAKAVELGGDKLQLWDMMGRPQSARTFTPGESPMYVIGEGTSVEEFDQGLRLASAQ